MSTEGSAIISPDLPLGNLNTSKEALATLMDFSKAFNGFDRTTLVGKLRLCDVRFGDRFCRMLMTIRKNELYEYFLCVLLSICALAFEKIKPFFP